MPSGLLPLTVAPGSHSLSSLGATPPTLKMLNLPTNQDACKGATLTLTYGGQATK